MTKKTVSLILIFAIFFSVIAMAVWGKIPETTADVYVTGLVFRNELGQRITTVNDSERQEKKITLKRDLEKEIVYTFQVEIVPSNATDLTLDFTLDSGEATIKAVPYRNLGPDVPDNPEAESEDSKSSETSSSNEASTQQTSSSQTSGESEAENPKHVYTYEITFQQQSVTTLAFFSNFSGTRRIKDYLMFVFEGSSHSGDIIL